MNEITKLVNTPLAPHFKLSGATSSNIKDEQEYMPRVSYVNVVGNLMYVIFCTRSYISHAIGVVRRHMHNLEMEH